MPGREDLPSTLRRSPEKAQRTWEKTHDSAVETYGEGERSHRTAFAAVKHQFEKVGDHWEPKGRKGPSDQQAAVAGRNGAPPPPVEWTPTPPRTTSCRWPANSTYPAGPA